ncbi:MAG: hypothetical protein H7336_15585 [Bacteriovorax sp.]|nr:hypothetical protein [Bacteriovorax sp.]
MRKGDILESNSSQTLHQKGVPALVSPMVLRSHHLGQIDIAYLERRPDKTWVLKIVEMKTSLHPSVHQMKRLRKTQDYLSRVLDMEALLEVKFCQKVDPTLFF